MPITAVNDPIIRSLGFDNAVRILWNRVRIEPNGCWRCMPDYGSHNPSVSLGGKRIGAHRLSLFIASNELPSHLYCLHKCGNSYCVKPSHLYWGSAKQNSIDRIKDFKKSGKNKELCQNLLGKHSDEVIRKIWCLFFEDGKCMIAIAKKLNISSSFVGQVLSRKRRKDTTKYLIGNLTQENLKRKNNNTRLSSFRFFEGQTNKNFFADDVVLHIRKLLNAGTPMWLVAKNMGVNGARIRDISENKTYGNVPGKVNLKLFGHGNSGCRSHNAKINKNEAIEIFSQYHDGKSYKYLAHKYNISLSCVWAIIARKSWKTATENSVLKRVKKDHKVINLTHNQVRNIQREYLRGKISYREIKKRYSIPFSRILKILKSTTPDRHTD